VALAYALAWLVCLPLWLRGQGLTQPTTTICAVLMMGTPALAAVVVHRILGRGRLLDVLGLRPGPWRRWLPYAFLAWLGPVLLTLVALALAAAFGVFRTDLVTFSGFAEVIAAASGDQPLPLPLGALVALSLVQVLVGAVINTVPALGEEIGWRGFLYDCLVAWPAWRRVLVTGVVWGVWHAPLILLGYNYPGLPPALALAFMVVFTTLLAGLLDWLRTASGNVYVTGLAHGAVNAAAGIALLFSAAGAPPNSASTGLLGWSGWIVLAAALMVVAVLRRRRRHHRAGSDADVSGTRI
jgi:membrane protease YdiL (CAAX protease family)